MDEGRLYDYLAGVYDDPSVAEAIIDHARELGTLPGILRGDFNAPTRQDAHAWYKAEGHKRVRRADDMGG